MRAGSFSGRRRQRAGARAEHRLFPRLFYCFILDLRTNQQLLCVVILKGRISKKSNLTSGVSAFVSTTAKKAAMTPEDVLQMLSADGSKLVYVRWNEAPANSAGSERAFGVRARCGLTRVNRLCYAVCVGLSACHPRESTPATTLRAQ